jgi:hypothetical protein
MEADLKQLVDSLDCVMEKSSAIKKLASSTSPESTASLLKLM